MRWTEICRAARPANAACDSSVTGLALLVAATS